MKRMNVLIVNAYSVGNAGDAAIIESMVERVRGARPDARVTVLSSYSGENESAYRRIGARSLPSVWDLGAGGRGCAGKYADGLAHFFGSLLSGFPRRPDLRAYEEADLVLGAGGGYLHSSRRGPLGLGFLNAAFHLWLARHTGKPLVLFPQSFGPFHWSADRRLARAILGQPVRVFSRERHSTAVLEQLGVAGAAYCPDVAFSMRVPDGPPARRFDGSPKVGVTVLDWRYAAPGATPAAVENYLDKIAGALRALRGLYPGLRAYVFPQVRVPDSYAPNDDLDVSRRLARRLDGLAEVVDGPDRSPGTMARLYREMDAFVGSRMHSCIFALCAGVPVAALAYQHKTAGTLADIGLGDSVLPVDTFTEEQLLARLQRDLADAVGRRRLVARRVASARAQVQEKLGACLRRLTSAGAPGAGEAPVQPAPARGAGATQRIYAKAG